MLLSRAKCQPLFENVNFDSAAWELIADLNHIDQISAGRKTNKNMVEKRARSDHLISLSPFTPPPLTLHIPSPPPRPPPQVCQILTFLFFIISSRGQFSFL